MSQLGELRWMLPPLVMCLVLTGIHGYLGIHVLSRKVIFVDLALAQIAALGSTYAVILGYDPRAPGQGTLVYLFSLGFTFVGAAVFSLTRMRHERVPQEAFIGIVYATASALALLLLAKATGESEHIKEMLVGNVLLVTWPQVAETAALYSVVGAFHWLFRKPLIEISTDPLAAERGGRRVRLWDFLFYASFGFVITSSVGVAGVLLVFSFLVVPGVIAFMFQERLGPRIVLAWVVGTACSAAGMLVSYYGDLPTGPSVVVCFGGLLVLAALLYYVRRAERRAPAAVKVLGGAIVVVALVVSSLKARRGPAEHLHGGEFEALVAALASGDDDARIEAVHHLAELQDPHAIQPLVDALSRSASDRLSEHIVQVLPKFGAEAQAAVPALDDLARREADPFLRLEAVAAILHLKDPRGFTALAELLEDEPPLFVEQQAGELLQEAAGDDFGIGRSTAPAERAQAAARLRRWLAAEGERLRFRPELRRFE
jgi:zinc/manganese transport system permease protein